MLHAGGHMNEENIETLVRKRVTFLTHEKNNRCGNLWEQPL